MTHTISLVIDKEFVKKLDKLRESSNISRSELIRNILRYILKDEELVKKVFEKDE